MRAIGITGLLVGAVALGGCSERNALTAPPVRNNAAVSAALSGDQTYQWAVSCSGDEAAYVRLYWFVSGVRIDSVTQYVSCPGQAKLSGTGMRPGDADAFKIAVGTAYPVSHEDQTWPVDPNAPFSAQLTYTFQDSFYACDIGGCKKVRRKVSGQVKVSS